MAISTTDRLSPVKLHYASPSYAPSKVFTEIQVQKIRIHKACFKSRRLCFGSRHLDDDALFNVWTTDGSGLRNPTSNEMSWILSQHQRQSLKSRIYSEMTPPFSEHAQHRLTGHCKSCCSLCCQSHPDRDYECLGR